MLKHFKYQGILPEKKELEIYNTFTNIAISFAGDDDFRTALDFRNYIVSGWDLLDFQVSLIESTWNAVYETYEGGVYPNKQFRNASMFYRKYIYDDFTTLSSEELMYLHIELASEYIIDLPKLNISSKEGYAYLDTYRNFISKRIKELRDIMTEKEKIRSKESKGEKKLTNISKTYDDGYKKRGE